MNAVAADPIHELESAARLLAARPTLAIPTAIASVVSSALIFFLIGALVVSVIGGALVGHAAGFIATLGAGALVAFAAVTVIMILSWLAHVVVIVAAHDAWSGRAPDVAAAVRVTIARLGDIAIAFFAVGVLAIVPFALCFILIGIPLIAALGFFLMYVTPAIVIGGESGLEAIRTSFRLTLAHPGFSAAGYLGIALAFVAGRVADAMFVHVPVLGLVSAIAIGGLTAAYGALVSVRFYDLLAPRVRAIGNAGQMSAISEHGL